MIYYTLLNDKVYCTAKNKGALKYYEPFVYSLDASEEEYKKGYFEVKNGRLVRKPEEEIKQINKEVLKNKIKQKILFLRYKIRYFREILNQKIKPYNGLLIFIIFIVFCWMLYVFYPILSENIPDNKDWFDLAALLSSIFTTVIAIVAIGYTSYSIKQQKDQWLKEEYIKREAKILLEFRTLLHDSEDAIRWFTGLTRTQSYKVAPKPEFLEIPIGKYRERFNCLNKLNNLYNKEQLIFRKYKIEQYMIYVVEILKAMEWYLRSKKDNLKYVLAKEDNHGKTYELNEYCTIMGTFVNSMHFRMKQPFNMDNIGKVMEDLNKNTYDKFIEKYKSLVAQKLNKLSLEIDVLTTYYDGDMHDSLKRWEKYFFYDPEE
ncbi:MAG: hypothetical protein LBR56_04460 [Sporomusaceae bacterium]|nr:hypothetical protein [Sporomusaceae bacterium]